MVGSPELFPPVEVAEDPESFPRLELLYNNAVKILNGEEIEELVPKDAKGKSKAPPKKDENKEKEKKKGKDEPAPEPAEPTPLEKELKLTLSKEKAIMRYRLALIRAVAISRLKELRGMAKSLYGKLDDWIYYSNKCENEAVDQLVRDYSSEFLTYIRLICSGKLLRSKKRSKRNSDSNMLMSFTAINTSISLTLLYFKP